FKEIQAADPLVDKAAANPVSARLHAEYARAYVGLGRSADAQREGELAVKMDDGNSEPHYAFARALEDKDPTSAKAHYERSLSIDPAQPEIRLAFGAFLAKTDPSRASAELNEYLRLSPKSGEAPQARKLLAELKRKTR